MSAWKPFFESLVAIFETEHDEDCRRSDAKNDGNEQEETSTHQTEISGTRLFSAIEDSERVECLVRTAWRELVIHARDTEMRTSDNLAVPTANSDMTGNATLSVAQEVFTRELVTAYENMNKFGGVQSCRNISNEKEQEARISSLERRLKETSEQADKANQALQVVMREKCDLKYTCDEYETKHVKLSQKLREARAENRGLRRKNMYLGNKLEELEAEVEVVQMAKKAKDGQRAREYRRAEMAELVVKQTSLHCLKLDKQLKSAKHSTKLMCNHLEELEKVQNEMKAVIRDGANRSEHLDEPRSIGRLEWLLCKSSRLVGRLGAIFLRQRSGSGGEDENQWERNVEHVSEEDVTAEETSTPRSSVLRKLLSVISNRRAGAPGRNMLQKVRRGLRYGISGLVTEARAHDVRVMRLKHLAAIELDAWDDEEVLAPGGQ
ncbi:hypothetical protein FGB62_292g014 [Gracilaria domingensis]|nr:hypothetical protein FGB62_292g014 [Gracilaria domingensis]